jgi:Relaxase/Mobilisation nuclease domain
MTGKSFRGCLQYCLHDKVADEKKNELVMKDRAEVILYNQCFGNAKELTRQFNEVRQLNSKLSKPVLHITLSLGKGESLPTNKLAEMARDCAQDLGFSNNQFVVVLHKDTVHPHIHIVANRIGYDGKTVSDSNNYQKIAKLCRKLELKNELKPVLSPNAFLPKELRNYQRLDQRMQQLQVDIKQSLAGAKNYEEFEQKMEALKYEVIRRRGIAFRDEQKVYTKGSEVGYSLATIEKNLAEKQELKIEHKTEIIRPTYRHEKRPEEPSQNVIEKHFQKEGQPMLDILLKPNPEFNEGINPSLLDEQRKRRRKHKHRHL